MGCAWIEKHIESCPSGPFLLAYLFSGCHKLRSFFCHMLQPWCAVPPQTPNSRCAGFKLKLWDKTFLPFKWITPSIFSVIGKLTDVLSEARSPPAISFCTTMAHLACEIEVSVFININLHSSGSCVNESLQDYSEPVLETAEGPCSLAYTFGKMHSPFALVVIWLVMIFPWMSLDCTSQSQWLVDTAVTISSGFHW